MDGKLTEQQRQAAADFIGKKRANIPCSSCGHRDFFIAEHQVAPQIYYPGGNIIIGGEAYPHIMLTCRNCGATQFYNAIIVGTVKP